MDKQPCAWCYYARMRTDICGIYCTGGFSNPDGQCEHFKDYDEWKGRLKMTREEYLENHDAHEGAEDETTETRCPICGSDEYTVIYVQDGEPIGCDACLDTRIRCPHCGSEAWDTLIWRDGKPIGCDRCVREVERWEWGG